MKYRIDPDFKEYLDNNHLKDRKKYYKQYVKMMSENIRSIIRSIDYLQFDPEILSTNIDDGIWSF
jgi:hypothetical protein